MGYPLEARLRPAHDAIAQMDFDGHHKLLFFQCCQDQLCTPATNKNRRLQSKGCNRFVFAASHVRAMYTPGSNALRVASVATLSLKGQP